MPNITVTEMPASEVKLVFSVSQEEALPYLQESAREINTSRPLPGFRPGKATYEDIVRAVGEMAVLQGALERIVRAFYAKAILEHNLDIVGSPSISVEKLVPGSDIEFTVIAPVEPKVTKIADLKICEVTQKAAGDADADLEKALQDMRKMRHTETLVDRAATAEDLVIVDLEIKRDGVVIEGGTGQDYRIYMAEEHYIPGFAKELEGVKAGEERTFTLKFPEEHYQKHVAGQEAQFTTKTKGVYEIGMPELNDEFAKGVGLTSIEELRSKLKENIVAEDTRRREEAAEVELLEKLVDGSTFSEIPQALITDETRRMLEELQDGVMRQGMKWEDYLASIKKGMDDLRMDMAPQAIKRIKSAILIKALAKQQGIAPTEEELDAEVDQILAHVPETDKPTRERVTTAEYRQYVSAVMRNRKTLTWLKSQCVKTAGSKASE